MTKFKPWDHVRTPEGLGFVVMASGSHVKVQLYADPAKKVVVYRTQDVTMESETEQEEPPLNVMRSIQLSPKRHPRQPRKPSQCDGW